MQSVGRRQHVFRSQLGSSDEGIVADGDGGEFGEGVLVPLSDDWVTHPQRSDEALELHQR